MNGCLGNVLTADSQLLSASTWTSLEGKRNLFALTDTKVLLRSIAPQTKEVLEELERANLGLPMIDVPPLSDWLDEDVVFPHYPYSRTWEEGINDPFVIFHTSGTMGLPKPLTYTNATMQAYDAMSQHRYQGQHLSTHDMTGRRIYVSFSMPHVSLPPLLSSTNLHLTFPARWFRSPSPLPSLLRLRGHQRHAVPAQRRGS